MTDRELKNVFLVSGIFSGKADSVILLGFQCTINPQNLIKIVVAIFETVEVLNFFLMWTTLNFRGRSKTKKWANDICRGTLDIECEWDWPVGLGQKIKNYFSSFRDFPGKADSVTLLGFERTINPQNLIKIVVTIFEKIKIFNFYYVNYP